MPASSHKTLLALAISAVLNAPLYAANFDVTVASDAGNDTVANTLSWAIRQANVAAGADTITLTTDVTISGVMKNLLNSDMTLQSDATTRTLSGGGVYRPLFVKSGTVTIKNLNLSNGKAKGGNSNLGGGGGGLGGALFIRVVPK